MQSVFTLKLMLNYSNRRRVLLTLIFFFLNIPSNRTRSVIYFPSNCHVMSHYHAGCSVRYCLTLMLITAGWHGLWSV